MSQAPANVAPPLKEESPVWMHCEKCGNEVSITTPNERAIPVAVRSAANIIRLLRKEERRLLEPRRSPRSGPVFAPPYRFITRRLG